jgi:type I restriction enzyme S subunit
MLLPLPPLDEQIRIRDDLDASLVGLNRLIRSEEHQVSLLREYRTRLIADVVTGQLDVREVAARLPALDPDEPAPADLDDDDEAPTADDLDEADPG